MAQNGIPSTLDQHIKTLDNLGGLDALGGPKVDNMYHAGWAWAGDTPFQYTKLIASHFGGTRNPMAVSWPARIKPNKTPRSQFHHVNDIVPTIYEILDIKPQRWSMVSIRTQSAGSAWPILSREPMRRRTSTRNISTTTAAAVFITTAGTPAHSGRSSLGTPRAPGRS